MKTANLFNDSIGLTIIKKMEFEGVDAVHDALFFAFHPTEIDDDEDLDDRFMALWTLFLAAVGWNEEDYWDEYRSRPNKCICSKCAEEKALAEKSVEDKSKTDPNVN
jgi:hypothetical protein